MLHVHHTASTRRSLAERPAASLMPLSCSIGPELVAAAMRAVKSTAAPVEFEIVDNIKDK